MSDIQFDLNLARSNQPFEILDYRTKLWYLGNLKHVNNNGVISEDGKIVEVSFIDIHGEHRTFSLSEFNDSLRMKE